MLARRRDQKVMRHALKAFNQVEQRNGMRVCGGSRGLSLEGSNPGGPLRAHPFAAEQARGRVCSFPRLTEDDPSAHPYPDGCRKEANRPQSSIGLREQHDQDDP